jgi:prepilin-type N-terminal cleavage/methylation domain-containing protein
MKLRSHRRRAFTLIELLAVLAIIGIASMIIVPSMSGFGRSSALTNSGNLVVNLASVARQNAVSKNTMTALVLLGQQNGDQDFRALTVLEYDPIVGWSQTGAWELLPNGIVVDPSDTTNCTFLTNSPQPFPFLSRGAPQANPPVFFRNQQVAPGNGYAARIFLPNGALQNPEKPAQLRLVEGFYDNKRVTYTRPDRQGKPSNYYDISILGLTGTTKVSRP